MTSVRTGRSFGRAAARVLRFLPGLFFFAFTRLPPPVGLLRRRFRAFPFQDLQRDRDA